MVLDPANVPDANLRDRLMTIFQTVDSQLTSIQNYTENESRKKVIYRERIDELEAEVSAYKKRSGIEALVASQMEGPGLSSGRAALLFETAALAQELNSIELELRGVIRKYKDLENQDASKFWQNLEVRKFVPMSVVVSIDSADSFEHALNVVAKNPAPIIDKQSVDIVSYLTFYDLIAFMVEKAGSIGKFEHLLETETLSEFMGSSKINVVEAREFCSVYMKDGYKNLLKGFESGQQLVGLMDKDDMVWNFLTPGVFRHVFSRFLKKVSLATPEKMGDVIKGNIQLDPAVILPHKIRVIDMILKMSSWKGKRVLGIADEKGELVASIDPECRFFRRYTSYTRLSDLNWSVGEFFTNREAVPICIDISENIEEVIKQIVMHKPPYLWVTEEGLPVGILHYNRLVEYLTK
eukprot:CAMPEP_0168519664 /NCGR_PEP_ID=MMETSP0405-20121227/7462_1 /TAXON_ID=498012 /ORGANISM="Trichosphaerium sp, Strain Am-I-7 wt" /LENGTH=408 /DNA_ID=CAMNT_0008540269 /DNA_START=26 /DNA_END=1252 /DNA_ORIENTATION=+